MKKEIDLLSWNVNGIRAATKKGLKEQITNLSPDILCIQEIKAKEDQFPQELLDWQGYEKFIFPAERPGYSGVAVFSREKPLSVSFGIGEERFDCEGRVLILEYPDFKLFNGYFPNGGQGPERLQYKMDFYEHVLTYARKETKPLLICGDVNTAHNPIDLARPKENEKNTGFLPMEREWIDRLIAAGFIDTFRYFYPDVVAYSWWDMKTRARERNVGWRIDYFFAAESMRPMVEDAYILPGIIGSDHCPVGLKLTLGERE